MPLSDSEYEEGQHIQDIRFLYLLFHSCCYLLPHRVFPPCTSLYFLLTLGFSVLPNKNQLSSC